MLVSTCCKTHIPGKRTSQRVGNLHILLNPAVVVGGVYRQYDFLPRLSGHESQRSRRKG